MSFDQSPSASLLHCTALIWSSEGEAGTVDMEKLLLLLLAMLLRVNLTESCNKSKPHVAPEGDSKYNQSDIALNDTKEEFYDYGDMTATVDEDHLEEDDSSDAFDDAEDDELCAEVTEEPQHQELPEAVIIGTKKGGTRALLEFLNIHSQVKRAKNEVHFYDKQYERGLEWYIQQVDSGYKHKYLLFNIKYFPR